MRVDVQMRNNAITIQGLRVYLAEKYGIRKGNRIKYTERGDEKAEHIYEVDAIYPHCVLLRDIFDKGRIREYGMDDLLKAMDNIRHSDFLRGENKNGWMITFDWFVKPNNFLKVLEGNYNGDRKHGSGAKTQRKVEPLIPFGTLGDDGNSDTLPFM